MRRRTWVSLAVVAAIVAALVLAVYLRKQAPPEVARLLPEADAIVYFNLKPLRELTHFDRRPVAHGADYQAFIDATGIEFERDLDQAAFAIHRMNDPTGPNGPVAYSEVFSGRFNGPRLRAYLAAQAASVEQYAGHDIYSIQHEGRTVRVAVLGYDLVAVSNTPTPEQIHSMIDRYHSAALPFSGDSLLSRYYSDVPLLSQAWGIGQIGLPFTAGNEPRLLGMKVPLPLDATFIASVRFLGSLHFRLEEMAPTDEVAKSTAAMVRLALSLLRSSAPVPATQDPNAAAWMSLLTSVKVQQKGSRAILSAAVPVSLLQSLLSEQKDSVPENQPQR